ncbi:MAG TPA: hypothetical protein VFI03_12215 [Solirubrobacterales bacterium]|nr:hypothetical protein [Solirubrobacterales bacterium]
MTDDPFKDNSLRLLAEVPAHLKRIAAEEQAKGRANLAIATRLLARFESPALKAVAW